MRYAIFVSCFLIFSSPGWSKGLWIVPDDFPTIQDAVSHASVKDGDTILVKPGIYMENVVITGKSILLRSEKGVKVTIIDGGFNGSTISCINTGDKQTVIDGFTITNGSGTPLFIDNHYDTFGGGVYCDGSSLFVENCLIKSNYAAMFTGHAGSGGGMFCWKGSTVSMENCIVTNNYGGNGGGIFAWDTTVTLTGNVITGNWVKYGAGGVYCTGDQVEIEITGNSITDNSVLFDYLGGGLYIFNMAGHVLISNNLVNGSNKNGILLRMVSGVAVVENTISYNEESGIKMIDSSCNEILRNQINDNSRGIDIEVKVSGSGSNTVYHNNFINNLFDARDEGRNSWNAGYPSGGNYWEAYTGKDKDGDGIGDQAFPLDGGADHLPRVFPYNGLTSNIHTFSSSSVGKAVFTLKAGKANAHRKYILLGSLSGTKPGIPLSGGTESIPLFWDDFTTVVILWVNSPFLQDFLGVLDSDGISTAEIALLRLHAFSGTTLYFAFALSEPWDYVSNPVAIRIVP